MKAKKIILALAAISLFIPLASAQAADGCRIKEEKLERKLAYAKTHNNRGQIAGLEKALAEVRANCDPAGLRADSESKVRDKEDKVREREREVEEARRQGDQNKIAKKQKKLRQAQTELKEAQAKHEAWK